MIKRLGSLATPMLLASILNVLKLILKELTRTRETMQDLHSDSSEFMQYTYHRHEKAKRLKPNNYRHPNKTMDEL